MWTPTGMYSDVEVGSTIGYDRVPVICPDGSGAGLVIEKVLAFDTQTRTFVTLFPGDPSNPEFIVSGGEGLIVYAKGKKI